MIKNIIKRLLLYQPLPQTAKVRAIIDQHRDGTLPYCPDDEGDLIFSLVRKHEFRACLETGFHTGSTALYLAEAVSDKGGKVTSICVDDNKKLQRGLKLLATEQHDKKHQLIIENSNKVLPELFNSSKRFDFIFVDGWKTFDHLAFEIYLFNQILNLGGIIFFDDAYMPSVRKANSILLRHYYYDEINYSEYINDFQLRMYQVITRQSLHRPYRAFIKKIEVENQPPFQDWHFYENF